MWLGKGSKYSQFAAAKWCAMETSDVGDDENAIEFCTWPTHTTLQFHSNQNVIKFWPDILWSHNEWIV